jgi:hypothetical protein
MRARSVTWHDKLALVRSGVDVDVHLLVLRAPRAGPAPTARAAARHPCSACGHAAPRDCHRLGTIQPCTIMTLMGDVELCEEINRGWPKVREPRHPRVAPVLFCEYLMARS